MLRGGVVPLAVPLLAGPARSAPPSSPRLGQTGLNTATRLLGLVLAAIAIETMADGLKVLFPALT